MRKTLLNLLLISALLLATVTPAFAQDEPDGPIGPLDSTEMPFSNFMPLFANGQDFFEVTAAEAGEVDAAAAGIRPGVLRAQPVPQDAQLDATLPTSVQRGTAINPRLQAATGRVRVVVSMSKPSASQQAATLNSSNEAQVNASIEATAQQEPVVQWILSRDPSAKILGRLRVALNAVIVETDAALLGDLAKLPGITMINPVGTYEMDLSETVPHIGAAAVQAQGFDGTGVVVAVLDSGIDYTHRNLGGEGTLAAYDAAYADPESRDGLFPTPKVIDGKDFVGETWPNGDQTVDEDPIDFEGHGTHVADIIAGASTDGLHKGVAPGASLVAVKVCSAVASSCNGVSLLLGVEFSLDRNGDGSTLDAVDVMNLSLGSNYGQIQDDLSFALANAVKAGVVVVASAGNGSDRPYITGSPSSTPEVISVAQTSVPSDSLFVIELDSVVLPGVGLLWQPWSATPVLTSGVLQYGNGAGGNLNACAVYPAGSLAGKTLLADRGTCSISVKVSNGAAAGAVAVIVANNAAQGPGEPPPSFSFGGGDPSVPGYTVTRTDGTLLKTKVGQTAVIDPASAVLIPNTMVSSSSRGPSYSFNAIKPDIGAPGASLSAEVGTGDGETAFGGTSGAAPMVAGTAALVLDRFPGASPREVRARLMNTGETNVSINPVAIPGYLAPITRIGAGDVRVNNALATTITAWDRQTGIASLSFGYHAVSNNRVFVRRVTVRNDGAEWRTLNVAPSFRYADDAASGAIQVFTPSKISLRPRSSTFFDVVLVVDPAKLPVWSMNGGSRGGEGFGLQEVEYDGYLKLSDGLGSIQLPWQILPRKAALVSARPAAVPTRSGRPVVLWNAGRADGEASIFALLGTSPRIQKPLLPGPGDNFAVVDLRAVGTIYYATDNVLDVGITTFGTRAHPAYPAEFDVYVDVGNDGVDEYVAYTAELNGFGVTGQTVVTLLDLNTGAGIRYFVDADLNSANVRMALPLDFMGIDGTTQLRLSVYAFDNYFTAALTDAIENMVVTPATPKFGPLGDATPIPFGQSLSFTPVKIAGGAAASPSQSGLLILYRNQAPGFEADIVMVK